MTSSSLISYMIDQKKKICQFYFCTKGERKEDPHKKKKIKDILSSAKSDLAINNSPLLDSYLSLEWHEVSENQQERKFWDHFFADPLMKENFNGWFFFCWILS